MDTPNNNFAADLLFVVFDEFYIVSSFCFPSVFRISCYAGQLCI